MTDREKTIDGFVFWIENEENGVCYIPLNLCKKIMELLKEQEPKPAKIDGVSAGVKYGSCPNCGEGLNSEVYPHWCGFCGQAVTWE